MEQFIANHGPGKPRDILFGSMQPTEELPAGSYIIFESTHYRQNVLALFEPQLYPDRITPTGEAERPYDVAGWTLPMQMGLESPRGDVNSRSGEKNNG